MRRHFRQLEEKDDQGNAVASEVGVGAAGAALSKCAEESEAAGGVVAGDAAGDGAFGGPGCESDGFFNEDGVPGGAVGTEEDDQPAPSGKDGAGGGMRCGVRAGAVDAVAGRPGQGTGGTGGVEEEVHEEIRNREQGTGNRDQGTGIRDQGSGNRTWLPEAAGDPTHHEAAVMNGAQFLIPGEWATSLYSVVGRSSSIPAQGPP